jgi:hypothetical protein
VRRPSLPPTPRQGLTCAAFPATRRALICAFTHLLLIVGRVAHSPAFLYGASIVKPLREHIVHPCMRACLLAWHAKLSVARTRACSCQVRPTHPPLPPLWHRSPAIRRNISLRRSRASKTPVALPAPPAPAVTVTQAAAAAPASGVSAAGSPAAQPTDPNIAFLVARMESLEAKIDSILAALGGGAGSGGGGASAAGAPPKAGRWSVEPLKGDESGGHPELPSGC